MKDIKQDEIEAKLSDGVLKIIAPKLKGISSKYQIEIK